MSMKSEEGDSTVEYLKSHLDSSQRPLYKAIAKTIMSGVQQGSLGVGTKLPAHRPMADMLGVTIGTISRAYAEVERFGIVQSRVGAGTFVTAPKFRREYNNSFELTEDTVDLARYYPILNGGPEAVSDTLKAIADDDRCTHMLSGYAPEAGHSLHRMAGARWMKYSGFHASESQIICTNGAQHALYAVMSTLMNSGDFIATEQFTYPGLLSLAKDLGVRVMGLELDDEGIIPDSLERVCRTYRVRALYCSPTLHNPSTATMSVRRRSEIAAICRNQNLFVFEDDAHGLMANDHPEALAAHLPERSVVISSVSKAVSAGLRVGYMATTREIGLKLAHHIKLDSWMASPLPHELAARLIMDGTADELRTSQLDMIGERRAMTLPLLNGLPVKTNENCGYVLVGNPIGCTGSEIESMFANEGVLIKSDSAFAVDGDAPAESIRISFTVEPDTRRLLSAVEHVANVLMQARRLDS